MPIVDLYDAWSSAERSELDICVSGGGIVNPPYTNLLEFVNVLYDSTPVADLVKAGLSPDQFYKAVGKELGNLSDNAAAMRAAKIDQPLKTKQELISVCFQAIVSRFRRDQSGEASDSEMEEEGQAGSDAAQKTASGAARKTADAGQQGSQANPGVSGSGSDSGSDFQAKRQYMIDQIMGSNVSVAAKSQQINAIMDLLSSVPAPVSSLRSSGRSFQWPSC